MYEEDEDLSEFSSVKSSFLKELYIVKVFKEYGIMYGLVVLFFTLCYVIVLLPYTAFKMYEYLNAFIVFISGGDENIIQDYWTFLICSLIGIFVIWIACKIADFYLDKKYGKKKISNKSKIL